MEIVEGKGEFDQIEQFLLFPLLFLGTEKS